MSTNSLYGGIFPSINFGALMSGQKIPKVDGMKEADRYPTPPNSEVVLLDSKDDTLLYIKSTDVNNYSTIKRCRYYEDPEPTAQELNDQRYITIDEFNKFKEELLNAQRPKYNNKQSNHNSDKQDRAN